MRIGSTSQNMGTGKIQMPMQQGSDSYSKNIQSQIANAQKQMQELGENKEMSLEEKMKKRQEIQQQISDLQNQLRQHQIEQRRESQQKKGNSIDDMLGGGQQARKAGKGGTGMSSASMQAIISADSSMDQVKVQGVVKSQMEGRAGVLKAEIKQDGARGGDVEKKKEELAEVEAKAEDITASQMSALSDINKTLEEAAKEDQKAASKTDDKDKTEKKDKSDKSDKTDEAGKTEDSEGISNGDPVKEHEEADGATNPVPEGVTVSTSEPVGNNVDVKL